MQLSCALEQRHRILQPGLQDQGGRQSLSASARKPLRSLRSTLNRCTRLPSCQDLSAARRTCCTTVLSVSIPARAAPMKGESSQVRIVRPKRLQFRVSDFELCTKISVPVNFRDGVSGKSSCPKVIDRDPPGSARPRPDASIRARKRTGA